MLAQRLALLTANAFNGIGSVHTENFALDLPFADIVCIYKFHLQTFTFTCSPAISIMVSSITASLHIASVTQKKPDRTWWGAVDVYASTFLDHIWSGHDLDL